MNQQEPHDGGYKPEPFEISVEGEVNDEPLRIRGTGIVPTPGVYKSMLNFSSIPQSFHPSSVAISVVSICCMRVGAMRNDAKNIIEMGADGYDTRRILTLPGEHTGRVEIEGEVSQDEDGISFESEISGQVELPENVGSNSVYVQRIDPSDDGRRLSALASGSLFLTSGEDVELRLEEEHELWGELSNPLTEPENRIVTESGTLEGRTYQTIVHSILDSENTIAELAEKL